uniref:Uncharacterized protein n=1 Tax=Amphimedon queenslandica TaxID=400682 RepID=A0A1X7SG45_AMPQE
MKEKKILKALQKIQKKF